MSDIPTTHFDKDHFMNPHNAQTPESSSANNDAIAKPSLENLIAYLHYQYPATRGNIPLEELCELIARIEIERDEARLQWERSKVVNKELSARLDEAIQQRSHALAECNLLLVERDQLIKSCDELAEILSCYNKDGCYEPCIGRYNSLPHVKAKYENPETV